MDGGEVCVWRGGGGDTCQWGKAGPEKTMVCPSPPEQKRTPHRHSTTCLGRVQTPRAHHGQVAEQAAKHAVPLLLPLHLFGHSCGLQETFQHRLGANALVLAQQANQSQAEALTGSLPGGTQTSNEPAGGGGPRGQGGGEAWALGGGGGGGAG